MAVEVLLRRRNDVCFAYAANVDRSAMKRRRTMRRKRRVASFRKNPDVRYWHKADIGLCAAHVNLLGFKLNWRLLGP